MSKEQVLTKEQALIQVLIKQRDEATNRIALLETELYLKNVKPVEVADDLTPIKKKKGK
jgi:hypothetical protein